ncbi:hypothetical protein M885DRAFT_521115 [Pelagophyceae sp. CCMP2097]|nr:hypothetical protein M885DRAFT_521115 [Pelagophyceae sp. CCMP2097]
MVSAVAFACVVAVSAARLHPTRVARGGGAAATIVGADGAFQADALEAVAAGGAVKGVVAAYGTTRTAKLLDAAFSGAAFCALDGAVDAQVLEGCLVLKCDADAAGAAFAGACADVVVLSVWTADDAAVEAVAEAASAVSAAEGVKPALIIVVHDSESGADQETRLQTAAGTAFGSVSVVALPHATYEADAYAAACGVVGAKAAAVAGDARGAGAPFVVSRCAAAWAAAGHGDEGLVASYCCDAAASELRGVAAEKVATWKRVFAARGAAPAGWATSVTEALVDAVGSYDARTLRFAEAHSAVRLAQRDSLKAFIADAAEAVQAEHVEAMSRKHLRRLERALARAAARAEDGALSPEAGEALERSAEFDFDLDVTRTELGAPLALPLGAARTAFADDARALTSGFAASPTALLLAAKAEERKANKATRAARREATVADRGANKAARPMSVACAVQLVAMLRPRGFGSLQGFCSYALGPHSILAGYANDRDMSGDMAASDAQPLLRLQPKLNFDLDI